MTIGDARCCCIQLSVIVICCASCPVRVDRHRPRGKMATPWHRIWQTKFKKKPTQKMGKGGKGKKRGEREGVRSDITVPAPPNERKPKSQRKISEGEFVVVRRSGRVSERRLVPFHHLHAFLCVCASKNTRIIGIRVYTRRFPIRKVMWRDNLHGRLR